MMMMIMKKYTYYVCIYANMPVCIHTCKCSMFICLLLCVFVTPFK